MSFSIYSALSGLKVKEEELSVVAHNMANVNTAGFKEENMTFEALLAKNANTNSDTPFVGVNEKLVNFFEGPMATTNNPFDVAIQGDAFFEIQNERGTFFTRNGNLTVNSTGDLVTMHGDRIMGTNGPINIEPGSQVTISQSGTISVNGESKDQIKLSTFADKKKLHSIGNTLFKADAGAVIQADTSSQVFQGKLEQSNTNVMRGLVKLMDISKQYQTYQKVISNQIKVEQEAVSSLGKIG